MVPQLVEFQRITLKILKRLKCIYKVSGSGGGDCILLINLTDQQKKALQELSFLVEDINYTKLKEKNKNELILNHFKKEIND